MKIKYDKLMKKLYNLAGEIGSIAEDDKRYEKVYLRLSDALDAAENCGLITYDESEENF